MAAVHISQHPLLCIALGSCAIERRPLRYFGDWCPRLPNFCSGKRGTDLPGRNLHRHHAACRLPGTTAAPAAWAWCRLLRAGLGMADAIVGWCPSEVWHLGLYRDHKTLKPITYYNKLSAAYARHDICYVVDPMLATGGSAAAALDIRQTLGDPRAPLPHHHRPLPRRVSPAKPDYPERADLPRRGSIPRLERNTATSCPAWVMRRSAVRRCDGMSASAAPFTSRWRRTLSQVIGGLSPPVHDRPASGLEMQIDTQQFKQWPLTLLGLGTCKLYTSSWAEGSIGVWPQNEESTWQRRGIP